MSINQKSGLYQALFAFSLAQWNVIYKPKWKYNWTLLSSHLVQTVSFLVFVIFWLKQCTNVTHSQLQQCCSAHTFVHTNSSTSKIYFNWLWMLFELKTSIRQGSGSLVRVCKSRNLVGLQFHNLRSGPILAVLIHSLWQLTLKLGSLCSLQPDFGHNADWLLEQRHRIWLAVGINGSWKSLFLAWLFSQMISHGRREGSILLSYMPSYVPRKFRKFRWLFISSQDLLYSWN